MGFVNKAEARLLIEQLHKYEDMKKDLWPVIECVVEAWMKEFGGFQWNLQEWQLDNDGLTLDVEEGTMGYYETEYYNIPLYAVEDGMDGLQRAIKKEKDRLEELKKKLEEEIILANKESRKREYERLKKEFGDV